jgi:phosphoserine phosphatase
MISARYVTSNSTLKEQSWPGFDYIFFDCDSTLCTIEGIDELARQKGMFEAIKDLTDAAMEGEVHLESVYDRRLEMLRPTRAEIRSLEQDYRRTLVPDAQQVIQSLQVVGKELFIISGGLEGAVKPFGAWLGIPRPNIWAVGVQFNRLSGQWWDYQQDRWGQRPDVEYLDPKETPLIKSQGKAAVIKEILANRAGRSMLVGDGMSDLAARPVVDLVVGFGGVVTRQGVADQADVFIKAKSLAPVLPFALSKPEQVRLLKTTSRAVLSKGLNQLAAGEVLFRSRE